MSGSLWAFIVVSVLGSVAPSYPLFLVCRLVMAFTGTIVYQASYILGEAGPEDIGKNRKIVEKIVK